MRIVVTGASGQLGAYLLAELSTTGHDVIAWSGSNIRSHAGIVFHPVDLALGAVVDRALDLASPDIVIHLAAISSAESVFRDPARAQTVNVTATEQIAAWVDRRDRRLVFTSTDLVFDGARPWYREDDVPCPVLAYGRTKVAAESAVRFLKESLVARLGLLYGPSRCGREGFYDRAIAALEAGQPREFFVDEFRTPTDYRTAAHALTGLALAAATGTVHIGGVERLSRYNLMLRAARALGIEAELVRPVERTHVAASEPRPADVSLDTTRLTQLLPDLERPDVEHAVASLHWRHP